LLDGAEFFFEIDVERGSSHLFLQEGEYHDEEGYEGIELTSVTS